MAGRAYVAIGADNSELVRTLANSQRKLQTFARVVESVGLKLVGLGAAALAGATAASRAFASMGSSLKLASDRTGIAVESLSQLRYAAEQAGVAADDLEIGVRHMQRSIVESAEGSQQSTEALRLLGVTVNDLRGKTPDQQFALLGDRIGDLKDPTLAAAESMAIFGRAGSQLIPMFGKGADSVSAMTARFRELGGVVSDKDATAALDLQRKFNDLSVTTKMLAFTLGGDLAPAARIILTGLTQATIAATNFARENKGLVNVIAIAGIGIGAMGVGLLGISIGARVLSSGLGVAITGLRAFSFVAGTVSSILGAGLNVGKALLNFRAMYGVVARIGGAVARLPAVIGGALEAIVALPATIGLVFEGAGAILAALTAPMFLLGSAAVIVGAAILGFGTYFLVASDIGKRAIAAIKSSFASFGAWIKSGFMVVFNDITNAFGGLKNSLVAGDFKTAAAIVMTTIHLEFARGIKGLWHPMLTEFQKVSDQIVDEWRKIQRSMDFTPTMSDSDLAKYRAERNANRDQADGAEVARLEKELAALEAKAASESAKADTTKGKQGNAPEDELPNRAMAGQSTFNPAAASRLGAGMTLQERTAKATEATAINTSKPIVLTDGTNGQSSTPQAPQTAGSTSAPASTPATLSSTASAPAPSSAPAAPAAPTSPAGPSKPFVSHLNEMEGPMTDMTFGADGQYHRQVKDTVKEGANGGLTRDSSGDSVAWDADSYANMKNAVIRRQKHEGGESSDAPTEVYSPGQDGSHSAWSGVPDSVEMHRRSTPAEPDSIAKRNLSAEWRDQKGTDSISAWNKAHPGQAVAGGLLPHPSGTQMHDAESKSVAYEKESNNIGSSGNVTGQHLKAGENIFRSPLGGLPLPSMHGMFDSGTVSAGQPNPVAATAAATPAPKQSVADAQAARAAAQENLKNVYKNDHSKDRDANLTEARKNLKDKTTGIGIAKGFIHPSKPGLSKSVADAVQASAPPAGKANSGSDSGSSKGSDSGGNSELADKLDKLIAIGNRILNKRGPSYG
jgi:TP901 family phage tail tape measure protein